MKLVSWNVNGLRAVLGKGMADAVDALEPDVLCLQEIKARPEQVKDLWISSWPHQLWNPAEKAGYSGRADPQPGAASFHVRRNRLAGA